MPDPTETPEGREAGTRALVHRAVWDGLWMLPRDRGNIADGVTDRVMQALTPDPGSAVLDGAEAHELMSALMVSGIDISDVHPGHPLVTGYNKVAAASDENHPRFSTPLPEDESTSLGKNVQTVAGAKFGPTTTPDGSSEETE